MTHEYLHPVQQLGDQAQMNEFAFFIFAWHLAFQRKIQTLRFPENEDCEELARLGLRSFDGSKDGIAAAINLTIKATHARFHRHDAAALETSVDCVLRLIETEVGVLPGNVTLRPRVMQ